MASDLHVQGVQGVQGPRSSVHVAARPAGSASEASFRALVSQRTPLAPQDAAAALSRAWRDVLGEPPPAGGVAVLWAQWALETGRGRAMYGFNFGNIKGAGPGGRSTLLSTHEGYGATEHPVRARFRAYDNVDEGARDYVRTLAERFPGSIAAARRGNAAGFVDALEHGRYFTAEPRAYRRGVASLAGEFEHVGPGGAPHRVEPVGQAEKGVLQALSEAIARHRG